LELLQVAPMKYLLVGFSLAIKKVEEEGQ